MTPPIGIPNPSTYFGWEIDRATPDWPASWTAGTPSATAGYYYIDKTASGATDTANPYGYPGKARLTPPATSSLAAGAFVYFHAGTYTVTDLTGRYDIYGPGTSSQPIWFTGNPSTHPVIQTLCHIGGYGTASYIVFENIDLSYGTVSGTDRFGYIDIRPALSGNTADHILIRNCTMTSKALKGSPGGVQIGSSTVDTGNVFNVSYVVVYNCTIHTIGEPTVEDSEECGIYKAHRTDYVWALENTIYDVGADCIAGAHSANDTDARSEHYFIGGNTLGPSGENGIDLKATRYVVISQNTVTGPFGREQGWGIVIHSGANPVPVRDCWIIFNRIHHCSAGIIGTSTNGTQDIGIVGNLIYDIRASYAVQPDPALNGWAIGSFATQGTGNFIAHNTVYDSDRGFTATGLSSSNTISSLGNIFNQVTSETLSVNNGTEVYFVSDYNLFDTAATFFWNNGTRNLAYMQGTGGVELNSISGDPDFVDAPGADFGISFSSPAIDVGTSSGAYAAFLALFGESIQFDFDGIARPQNGDWDTGALEYVGAPATIINADTFRWNTLLAG